MALDPTVQRHITNFIQGQFPRFYEEYGPAFIDFVTAYYQWSQTQGPLFDSRRLSDYQDIDVTDLDRFLVFFKDKYLPNIQLETVSNVKLLVKHSLDVYRSRGTKRAIDLLFRLVFGVGADVYYPFDDVFQPSSGEWIIPRYIEVSTQDDLNKFVGKEIYGVTSGAQAFVESWVRKKSGSTQIDILYLSVIEDNFKVGERINTLRNPFNLLECPSIIGSLTNVNMTSGGSGFKVGDTVDLVGSHGYGGRGRVASIGEITGTVSFNLRDGGYGYTANSKVLVSQYVLSMSNVQPGNTNSPNYFSTFETIKQPMANILYQSAVGGYIVNNDIISTYYANGTQMGSGIVLSAANGTSTNGQIFVAVLSGNLSGNSTLWTQGNTKTASVPVGGYTDLTATGNVMSESANAVFSVKNINGTFQQSETVTNGVGGTATVIRYVSSGPTGKLYLGNRVGTWVPNTTVKGSTSSANASIANIAMAVGVINATGSFLGDVRAPLIATTSGTTGVLPFLNQGAGATFTISPTLLYPETVLFNTDYVYPYLGTSLAATSYGFPANPTGNLTSTVASCLTYTSYTFGAIASIRSQTPGSGYTQPPMVRIYEPLSYMKDIIKTEVLNITGASSSFPPNEIITQTATNAKGMVVFANSTTLRVNRLSIQYDFTPTTNSTTIIVGQSSGVTANVISTTTATFSDPEDVGQTFLGFNAQVDANTSSANGTVKDLQVISSGWGYLPGESLLMVSGTGVAATGEAVLVNQGVGQGFYRTEDGFLSDIKKIHDNDYYQVSAYDIGAAVDFEHYKDMLKSLLHMAGTRPFGTFVHTFTANIALDISSVSITKGANTLFNDSEYVVTLAL